MKKELEIWQFAANKLRQNESVTLLVVAESSGSSPGRQGFKMIVSADEMRGSIGGGVMETRIAEQTKFKIQNPKSKNKSKIQNLKSKIISQVHRKNSPDSSGMICSGKQTIILFKLNSTHLKVVREIIFALKKNESCQLKISNLEFQITGKPPEGGTQNDDFKFEKLGENEFVYEEKLGFKNKLFIIGGGHCALALSEIAAKLDFHISLFDDRADLNTLAKNKFADRQIIVDSYENIGELIDSGANHFVVVMTLGYKFDEIVIRRLFDKNFKYFGVLGSKAKMKTLLKNLEKENFDREKLKKIRAPIGLPIRSRTPEEIAVSIAAEIIFVKNCSDFRRLST